MSVNRGHPVVSCRECGLPVELPFQLYCHKCWHSRAPSSGVLGGGDWKYGDVYTDKYGRSYWHDGADWYLDDDD
jgi:hypothetical protein